MADVDESSTVDVQLNPFRLHHSYSSSIVLVTQPLLRDRNYGSWIKAMMIVLSRKNKKGFIDGTIKKLEGRKSTTWKCNNDLITSWILNFISKEIVVSINYTRSANVVWDELHIRFKQSNGSHVYQLQKELVTMNQGTMSVESYYTELKTIWQYLCNYHPKYDCTCDGIKPFIDHLEYELVMIFLMGLSDSYVGVRAQFLLMNPIPEITKVFSLIFQEEHQRSVGQDLNFTNLIILAATEASKRQNNDQSSKKENQRLVCSHCNVKGHTVDKCYRLHEFHPGYTFQNSNSSNSEAPLTKQVEANALTVAVQFLLQSKYGLVHSADLA